ncbi:TPA: hypothetical protein N0F65_008418 [Lagenidium giganteum]|uniref:protein-tyrosine-phosphatase n=1 Tax=Lagenidium giganteum TaxID=4803 RepID=A0AAV2Z136_9STRA|nr:TPA: hypothetical protein N0F65_008418 [Lagenidium giganteum]
MCRHVLFTSDDLMEHEPQKHTFTMRRVRISIDSHHRQDDCTSYFLADTMPWMDEDHLAEGKLICPMPKCQSRVGHFQWAGAQCSCGTWVTPSVKITKSRVDKVYSTAAIPIVQGVILSNTVQQDAAADQPSAQAGTPVAQP